MKQFIKSLIPPILFNLLNRYRNRKYGWHGDYETWEEVQNISTGYESDEILQKVKNSLLKVKNGNDVYERDSVLFDKIQYSWPILSGLMLAAAKSNGSLRVLDFGGSLGSTYYQNKKILNELDTVTWSVVEQNHFVETGKKDFEDERLKFYYDVESCMEAEHPNVLLISSVLQYIEKPYELLDQLLTHNFEFVIFDRTPFSIKNCDEIKLQVVPPSIYTASYPCWFFEDSKLLSFVKNKGYKLVESFNAIDGESNAYYFKGFIFEKL